MNNTLLFAQRMIVAYATGFIGILCSILIAALQITKTSNTSDVLWLCLACGFAVAVFVMYLDGRPVLKHIHYYSKYAMLNYVFSLYVVAHSVFMSGSNQLFILLPAMLLSFFNIFLFSKIHHGLSEHLVIPELQRLYRLLPEINNVNIDFDYTFLRKTDLLIFERRFFKIMTTMGELLFDGCHIYLNGEQYEVDAFVAGFKACAIDINSSTPEDAVVMQMYCV